MIKISILAVDNTLLRTIYIVMINVWNTICNFAHHWIYILMSSITPEYIDKNILANSLQHSQLPTIISNWNQHAWVRCYIYRINFSGGLWTVARAGVKYVLSNTNTNTKIWIFQIQMQIQIQIFCSTLIQIQIQIQIPPFKYKYKYKYVQPNISSETVQIQNRAILWIPRYMLMACVSLCLGDTWR